MYKKSVFELPPLPAEKADEIAKLGNHFMYAADSWHEHHHLFAERQRFLYQMYEQEQRLLYKKTAPKRSEMPVHIRGCDTPFAVPNKFTPYQKEILNQDFSDFFRSLHIDPSAKNNSEPLNGANFKILGRSKIGGHFTYSETVRSLKNLVVAAESGSKICHFVQGVASAAEMGKRMSPRYRSGFVGKYRTEEDAYFYRNWFFDIDHGRFTLDALMERIESLGLLPRVASLVETSTNKFHVYMRMWDFESVLYGEDHCHYPSLDVFLRAPRLQTYTAFNYRDYYDEKFGRCVLKGREFWDAKLSLFQSTWRAINDALTGDPSGITPLRIAQVPGFFNPKSKFQARLAYSNVAASALSLQEAVNMLPAITEVALQVASKEASRSKTIPVIPKWITDLAPSSSPSLPSIVVPVQAVVEIPSAPSVPVAPIKVTWGRSSMPTSYVDYLSRYNLKLPVPLDATDLTGRRNEILLILSRFAHRHISSPADEITFFDTVIRSFFAGKTSHGLSEDPNRSHQFALFKMLLKKTRSEVFAPTPTQNTISLESVVPTLLSALYEFDSKVKKIHTSQALVELKYTSFINEFLGQALLKGFIPKVYSVSPESTSQSVPQLPSPTVVPQEALIKAAQLYGVPTSELEIVQFWYSTKALRELGLGRITEKKLALEDIGAIYKLGMVGNPIKNGNVIPICSEYVCFIPKLQPQESTPAEKGKGNQESGSRVFPSSPNLPQYGRPGESKRNEEKQSKKHVAWFSTALKDSTKDSLFFSPPPFSNSFSHSLFSLHHHNLLFGVTNCSTLFLKDKYATLNDKESTLYATWRTGPPEPHLRRSG